MHSAILHSSYLHRPAINMQAWVIILWAFCRQFKKLVIYSSQIYEGFILSLIKISMDLTELMNMFASPTGVTDSRLCLLFKNQRGSHLDFVVSSCLLRMPPLCCHACKRAAGEWCQWRSVYAAGSCDPSLDGPVSQVSSLLSFLPGGSGEGPLNYHQLKINK